MTTGVVLVCIIAIFSFITNWNNTYGQNVGSSFNNTYSDVAVLINTNMFNLSTQVANNTNTQSGAGTTSVNIDLASRALSVITSLGAMLGLIPALFTDGALLLGIPSVYAGIAGWIFIFMFAILFAYLLIIGVRRLL